MSSIFEEALVYHHHYNNVYIDIFRQHWNQLPAETYPLFCHVLNAQQIWCARILGLPQTGVRELHKMEDCTAINDRNLELAKRVLAEKSEDEMISYTNSKGEAFSNSVRDIVFHLINHSTHHKGQIAMQLRQNGIQPPVTDYIFYKR